VDAVFVIWAVDGWFPSARCLNNDEETEEERRLMYVALTRARNNLSVSYPLNAYSSRREPTTRSTSCAGFSIVRFATTCSE